MIANGRLFSSWCWALHIACLLVALLLGNAAQAQFITVSPTQVSLNASTGGTLQLRLRGPPRFDYRIEVGFTCKALQPLPPVPANIVCGAGTIVPLQLGFVNGRFGLDGTADLSGYIGAQALAANPDSAANGQRYTHVVFIVRSPAFSNRVVVRINLIEPSRGPEATELRLRFLNQGTQQSVGFFRIGQTLPPLEAQLRFKGSGLLRARWEVVQPGDPEPTALDLTPEAYLSLADRARQHRYRVLGTVQTYLSATGLTRLPGPDPRLLPNDRYGTYQVLLRLEQSQALDPALAGAAPLVLPVLRYSIGESAAAVFSHETPGPITVLAPQGLVFSDRPLVFSWQARADIALYRLELERAGQLLYAARVAPDAPTEVQRYTVPAFVQAQLGMSSLRWRVVSVGADGNSVSTSRWVDLQWGLVHTARAPAPEPDSAAPVISSREPSIEPDLAHEPGDLLVLWANPAEADAGLALLASRHLLSPQRVLRLDALELVIAQFQLADTAAALALRDRLRREQPEWVVDLNARATLQQGAGTAPTLPMPRLFALAQLQLPPPLGAAATALKLGVVDAQLDPALPLNVSARHLQNPLSAADMPAATEHGNEVAQLLAGLSQASGFVGATAGAQLYWSAAMRQQGGRASSHTLLIAAAVDWLLGQRVHVINLSLGGAGDAVLQAVFERLRQHPVLLVAAAGNGGPGAPSVYPAAYPGVLAVTATDADLRPYARANRGPYISLAAPGVDVWVPQRPGQPAAVAAPGQYLSGTSYAAALATAALARAPAALWQLPKARQLDSLCRAARDLGAPGRDPVFGCGLVQAGPEALAREAP